jgi:hypothetical protein
MVDRKNGPVLAVGRPAGIVLALLLLACGVNGLHGKQTIPKSTCMAQSHTSRNNEIVNEWKPCPDALYLKEGGQGCRDFPVGIEEVGNCCCPGDYSCDFNDCYQFKGHSDIDWFCDCSNAAELVYALTPESIVMNCGSCKPDCKQLSLVVELETKQKDLTGPYKACVEGNPNLKYANNDATFGGEASPAVRAEVSASVVLIMACSIVLSICATVCEHPG